MELVASIESLAVQTVLGLPESVQRRLAGRPVTLDGQTLAVDLQLMLRLQKLARKRPLEPSEVANGRRSMTANARLVGGNPPIGTVRDLEVAGLGARHYLPTGHAGPAGPLLLFFHGGGFLYGDLDSHDAPCRVLAEQSGVPVLAIDYGLGPEHAFPEGFDDAVRAHEWVVEHAAELRVDPQRIGVTGDSAGGNIAAWVAIAAARSGTPLAWQLLVYPCTQPRRQTRSSQMFGEDFYLTRDFMDFVDQLYLPTEADFRNERVDLLNAEIPADLAPGLLVTAGFDPLRDEGEAYAVRLQELGVKLEVRRYDDQIHGFLNIVGAGRSSRAAVVELARDVRDALR